MLARIKSIDKFDNNVIAFDCQDEEFRSIEVSLYQVLHRTTSNEPLSTVQQTRGQKGIEAWHAIVLRYDQEEHVSQQNSAYAALISIISEKDRAKDVEQFDDILRTFTNGMNKFENRIWQDQRRGEDAYSQEIDVRKLAELQVQRDDDVVQ